MSKFRVVVKMIDGTYNNELVSAHTKMEAEQIAERIFPGLFYVESVEKM